MDLVRTTHEERSFSGYDLYIFDGSVPDILPEDGNVVVFAPQPNSYFQVGDWMSTPEISYMDNSIFNFVEDLSFSIGRTRIIESPTWAETIMEYDGNPIIIEGVVNNTRILVFGFDLYETDSPPKTEFPILISNIINEYAPYSGTVVNDAVIRCSAIQTKSRYCQNKCFTTRWKTFTDCTSIPPEPFVNTNSPGIYCLEQIKDSGNVITFLI